MTFSHKKQQGLTFLTIIFILGIIAFFALLTLKIAPIYMNHSKVANALEALEEMPRVEELTKREILKSLNKRFGMNYVEHVGLDDVTVSQHDNYLKVGIRYDRVEKIVGNLSVLVEFDESFEVGDSE